MLMTLGCLAACDKSAGGKEYSVPRALCGVSVDQDLLSEFLPAGKRVDVTEKSSVPGIKRCRVTVDGKLALIASQEWWDKGDSIVDVARAYPQLESARLGEGDAYLNSATGGVGRVKPCVSADYPEKVLYAAVQIYAKDVEDEPSMKKFITAYVKAVGLSSECQ
ncbi:hypothetical protein Sipo8835_03430 [Streptomyces ipomoeae]|uniref:Uncharacterized protein n=1 Tax=Streptomyces ipomoeae TaxID=103232 RepID=A0AAE8W6J8_9ACTN|nr:hypothetical protein [Streptomyces ipomoeae]TQE38943.1 hypothetical protein Sipo8835_03430 [Streptomyces ipomoeae]